MRPSRDLHRTEAKKANAPDLSEERSEAGVNAETCLRAASASENWMVLGRENTLLTNSASPGRVRARPLLFSHGSEVPFGRVQAEFWAFSPLCINLIWLDPAKHA